MKVQVLDWIYLVILFGWAFYLLGLGYAILVGKAGN